MGDSQKARIVASIARVLWDYSTCTAPKRVLCLFLISYSDWLLPFVYPIYLLFVRKTSIL